MAVIVIAEAKNQTAEKYDGMLAALADAMRQWPGFILHTSHPTDDGWRVFEIWESAEAANRFFAQAVAPNLPPGIRPKRSVHELHALVKP